MKKLRLLIFSFLLIFLSFTIFYFIPKSYELKYTVKGYNIIQTFNNKKNLYIFKINKNNIEYLYAVSDKYYQNHKQIKSIKQNGNIIYVTNSNLQNFYINKENDSYYSAYYETGFDDKKKFTFDNIDVYNINANFYIWNYSQFININSKVKKEIKLFDNDIYNIDLCTTFNDYLLIADYSSKYKFNKFYLINTKNNKVKEVSLDEEVYFNSYFLGTYKKFIYLYDMQNKMEYKINPLKNTIYKNRYEILNNNKFEKVSVNKLNKGNVSFKEDKDFYFELNDNKLIYVTPINKINVTSLKVSNIIFSNDNECYFISDDTLYYVNKDKITKLMTYSEWKFNNDYIYIFK